MSNTPSPQISSPGRPFPQTRDAAIFSSHLLLLLLVTFLLPRSVRAADSDFNGPPIERDTLKKDPDSRYRKMYVDRDKDAPTPDEIAAHIDDYRKMFWNTYPDKPEHETAREAFAQALFLKDLQFLQGDLWIQAHPDAHLAGHPIPTGTPAGGIAGVLPTGNLNLDGGIPQTATPEYQAWVEATRQALGPITAKSNFDDVLKAGAQVGFGIAGADYRNACNFGGKEYQAYLMERDWAEFDKAGKIPAGYDNPKKYGIYLYYRNAQLPIEEARTTYADMALLLGPSVAEAAAQKVLTAAKTPDQRLITRYPTPTKHSPSGEEVPDYDVPMPKDISGFYTEPLHEMEALATESSAHAYFLYLFKARYTTNYQHHYLDAKTTEWSFAQSTYLALSNAFGSKQVLDVAEKVRTATKRQVGVTIMDPKALGATRNNPIEAYEDILAKSDPKGYVKAALAFENIKDPGSIDVNAAYQKLLATTDEKSLLQAAQQCALDKPRFAFRDELARIKERLAHPNAQAAAGDAVDDPDYLAWKKFPDTVKVSYIIRGWSPNNAGQLAPANPTARYTLSVHTRTPDLIVLWDTEIDYDQPGNVAHPPHDIEIGYAAKRPLPPAVPVAGPSKSKGGQTAAPATAAAAPAPAAPTIESGDEKLNVAGRTIATRWTSTSRTSGGMMSITKTWSSDEIPGGLVRKTEERSYSPPIPGKVGTFRETVLESFQGFTPGAPAAPGAAAPGGPAAASTAKPATQPARLSIPPTPAIVTPPSANPATPPAAPQPASPAALQLANQRESAIVNRRAAILTRLRAQPQMLTPDISAARNSLEKEITAAVLAIRARNFDEASQHQQSAEDELTVMEKSLNP